METLILILMVLQLSGTLALLLMNQEDLDIPWYRRYEMNPIRTRRIR